MPFFAGAEPKRAGYQPVGKSMYGAMDSSDASGKPSNHWSNFWVLKVMLIVIYLGSNITLNMLNKWLLSIYGTTRTCL